MKFSSRLILMLGLGFALSAGAATLTTDPLTGLSLIPATDSRLHLGNEPTTIPDSQICNSKMRADFYSVFDSKVNATVTWYAAHLPGFHKTHAYADNRSQDTFYNDAGTLLVSVTGEIGKEGENTETYSAVYSRMQPGFSAKTIIALNQRHISCQ
jgi:hypothetical protein